MIITGLGELGCSVEIEVIMLSMLETVLATPMRTRAFSFMWGFGIVRFILGIAIALVLIWLLLKLCKLVDAYTKKLK